MSEELEPYEVFAEQMETRFPKMFEDAYGGFACGEGWWPILESLCANIQSHIDWRNKTRAKLLEDNPYNHPIPDEVEQVTVRQIKEKFGGLRFYYDGGDEFVDGMVTMAESWASRSCEDCGSPATKQTTGWIKNVCDKHFNEIEERKAEQREKYKKEL
jgi:hypothetical protein